MSVLKTISCFGFCSQLGLVLVVVVVAVKVYIKATTGICKSKRRLDGMTAIVTGANAGIGKETALDLASRGARVILASRNLERTAKVRDEIITQSSNRNVVAKRLDLTSLKSVRSFGKDILANEKRLDILVNNAGVALDRRLTEDGLDCTMQTNHFGHFLLTNMLLGLMKKTEKARIVVVSSIAHDQEAAAIDFENLNGEKKGDWGTLYCMSKLCNVLFVKELTRRLEGTGITANSLHPGVIPTEIFNPMPYYLRFLFQGLLRLFLKDEREGAQTTIYLAVSEEVEGVSGKYFADCKVKEESKLARDAGLAKKLWEVSEKLVKLQAEERHL